MIKQSKYKYFKLEKIELNISYFKFHVSRHQVYIYIEGAM